MTRLREQNKQVSEHSRLVLEILALAIFSMKVPQSSSAHRIFCFLAGNRQNSCGQTLITPTKHKGIQYERIGSLCSLIWGMLVI